MIKLVFLMRKRRDISIEFFKDYLLNHHAPLVARHSEKLGIRHYVQSHSTALDLATLLRGPASDCVEPYDAMAEIWLDGTEAVLGTPGDPDMAAIQAEMRTDERVFLDRSRSNMFISDHHVIVD